MFSFFKTPTFTDREITIVQYEKCGREPRCGIKRTYSFHIYLYKTRTLVGHCDLRIGESDYLYYMGHIGYNVYKPYRGHHYAAKACRLLMELAKKEKMPRVIITCSPENIASYKTITSLNAKLLEIADVPKYHELYERGEKKKCIFEIRDYDALIQNQ